jgi:hypothetical protein
MDRATGSWGCRRSKRYRPSVFFGPLLRVMFAELGNDVGCNIITTLEEEFAVSFRERTEIRCDVRVECFYRDLVRRLRVR